jgi:two-component system, OmpR family, response regulator RegX3
MDGVWLLGGRDYRTEGKDSPKERLAFGKDATSRFPCEHVSMRLLVVEDDATIAEPLRTGLRREGFEVDLVSTGADALAAPECDLVLLDLGLPDLDGRVVCRTLRERSDTPIIVVSARGEEVDRVILFELGADDYVVKPFGFLELVARIRAVLRRTAGGPSPSASDVRIEAGLLQIDVRTRNVTFDGRPILLTPREYDLLVCLARDPNVVHTREELIESVWDENWWGSTKTLDVHIASLRKKLAPEIIETVRGVGFRLIDDAAAQ